MDTDSHRHGPLIWAPDPARPDSQMTRFRKWVAARESIAVEDYHALLRWSVEDVARFWEAMYTYFRIDSPTPWRSVLSGGPMPDARWFDGASVNFAHHVLRALEEEPDRPALIAGNEDGVVKTMSRGELLGKVRAFGAWLSANGIEAGSHVAAYVINDGDAVAAFLACTAIGAVWTSVSPDFGIDATSDRFAQFEPQLLIATDGYVFGGKPFDRTEAVNAILGHVPSIERVVHMRSRTCPANHPGFARPTIAWEDVLAAGEGKPFAVATVDFRHPLIVCFSSGTTGKPKGIVHGHGGITLEAFKINALHADIGPDDVYTFATTTGWMVWFMAIAGMTTGAVLGLFDGNPLAQGGTAMWRFLEQSRTTVFGISSAFLTNRMQAGDRPNDAFDLSALRTVTFGASPAAPEAMEWAARNIGQAPLVNTASGGTEIFTCFVGYCPDVPSYAGEFQCTWLGTDLVAMADDGRVLDGEIGELVVRQPMPTMPIRFLNDPDGARLRAAYFEDFPGMWRHGDLFVTLEDGTSRILGRSDATLNRGGVRIGTAEIYDIVERVPAIGDSLVINVEHADGSARMSLFVQLAEGQALTPDVRAEIAQALRTQASPRHVPDEVIAVPGIPYNITGKKLEVSVKRLFMGAPIDAVVNRGIMRDPAAIDAFIALSESARG